jgi:hypothetical protein
VRRLLLVAAVLAVACVQPRPGVSPDDASEWMETLTAASVAAHQRRYAVADSLLAEFMSDRWGSWQAREAAYWRAVYLLDPQNPRTSAREALPLLELYLGDSTVVTHSQAARALWALATRQDSLRLALLEASARPDTVVQTQAVPSPSPREEELAREIAKLKEQLVQTTAELERIKRRLTTPP